MYFSMIKPEISYFEDIYKESFTSWPEMIEDKKYISTTNDKHIKYQLCLEKNKSNTNNIFISAKINDKDVIYTLME